MTSQRGLLTGRLGALVRGPVVVKVDLLALLGVNLTPLVEAVMAEALAVRGVVTQLGALQNDKKKNTKHRERPRRVCGNRAAYFH